MTIETPRLTIRSLEARDLGALATELGLGLDHIEGRWAQRERGMRTMVVAEMEGRFAGAVSFEMRQEFPQFLYLFALAVVPWAQNQGVGTELIAVVEDEARRRLLAGVYLGVADDNDGARRLYERLGYRREGEPYISRWTWRGHNGVEREILENVYRMFKRFPAA